MGHRQISDTYRKVLLVRQGKCGYKDYSEQQFNKSDVVLGLGGMVKKPGFRFMLEPLTACINKRRKS